MARARKKPFRLMPGGKVSYKLDDDESDVVVADLYGHPANMLVYRPEPRHLVDEAGSWVMITRPLPPMEKDLDKHVIVGRVFYAERPANGDAVGYRPDGSYLIDLRTPFGDLKVWPYEYATVAPLDLMAMWQSGELLFHPLNTSSQQLNDTLFYARSRGIALPDAMVMALGSLVGNIGWFEPAPELAQACLDLGSMAERVGILTDVNHARRKAAQKAKHQKAEGGVE